MGPLRIAAAVFLMVGALSASAQCVSEVREITGRFPSLEVGPIAWNGSVLAITGTQLSTDIVWVTIADERGTPLFDRLRLSDTQGGTVYDILSDGKEFSLWYRDANQNLKMSRISATGAAVGLPANVGGPAVTIAENDQVDITWSPALDAYVLVRTVTTTAPEQLWMTVVNANGTIRSTSLIATDLRPGTYARVAVTASGIIGLFYEQTNGSVRMRRVPSVRNSPYDVWDAGADDLVVAARGEEFVMARSDEDGRVISWKVITNEGERVRDDTLLLAGRDQVRPISLHARDEELAISYIDGDFERDPHRPRYRLLRFRPNGEPIADVFFAAGSFGPHRAPTEHDFVWTGTSYVSPGILDLGEADESYLFRYCPLVPDIFGSTTVQRGDTATFTGNASGGVGPYRYEWRYAGGGSFEGPQFQLTFTDSGQFAFELTVTDATGAQATQLFTITIVDQPPPPGRRRSVRH